MALADKMDTTSEKILALMSTDETDHYATSTHLTSPWLFFLILYESISAMLYYLNETASPNLVGAINEYFTVFMCTRLFAYEID